MELKNKISSLEIDQPDFENTSSLEWLETNGCGGYASGTVSGANTRRYHGLLIAATEPPVKRVHLVSKIDETIIIGNKSYELSCNQYPEAVSPHGYRYLKSFSRLLFPEFVYSVPGGISIKKTKRI